MIETPGERIKLTRLFLCLPQQIISEILLIPTPSYSSIELNRYAPPDLVLSSFEKIFNISPEFIMLGHPPIFNTTLSFLELNQRKHRYGRTQITIKDFVSSFMYVLHTEKISEVLTFDQYFCIQNKQNQFLIFHADRYIYRALSEHLTKKEIVVHTIQNQTPDIPNDVSKIIFDIYNNSDAEVVLKRIKDLSKELQNNRVTVKIFSNFISACQKAQKEDILTANIIIENSKPQRIASYLLKLKPSKEQISKAVEIYNKERFKEATS
jgi:hypothetical protein